MKKAVIACLFLFSLPAFAADPAYLYCQLPFTGTQFRLTLEPVEVMTPSGTSRRINTVQRLVTVFGFQWQASPVSGPTPPSAGKCVRVGVTSTANDYLFNLYTLATDSPQPTGAPLPQLGVSSSVNAPGQPPFTTSSVGPIYCPPGKLLKVQLNPNSSPGNMMWAGTGLVYTCVNSLAE